MDKEREKQLRKELAIIRSLWSGITIEICNQQYFYTKKGAIIKDSKGGEYEALNTGIYVMLPVFNTKKSVPFDFSVGPDLYKPMGYSEHLACIEELAKAMTEEEFVHVCANLALNEIPR